MYLVRVNVYVALNHLGIRPTDHHIHTLLENLPSVAGKIRYGEFAQMLRDQEAYDLCLIFYLMVLGWLEVILEAV